MIAAREVPPAAALAELSSSAAAGQGAAADGAGAEDRLGASGSLGASDSLGLSWIYLLVRPDFHLTTCIQYLTCTILLIFPILLTLTPNSRLPRRRGRGRRDGRRPRGPRTFDPLGPGPGGPAPSLGLSVF